MIKIFKHLALSLALLSLAAEASAQKTIDEVAKTVCAELQKLDLSENNLITQKKAFDALSAIVPKMDHKAVIEHYCKNNKTDGMTREQIEEAVLVDLAYTLMRDCPVFTAIAMNGNKLLGQTPKEIVPLGEKVSKLLKEKEKTGSLNLASINESIMAVAEENKAMLAGRYGENYMAPLNSELRSYLLTRCEPYMKWSAREAIKKFRMLQSLGL